MVLSRKKPENRIEGKEDQETREKEGQTVRNKITGVERARKRRGKTETGLRIRSEERGKRQAAGSSKGTALKEVKRQGKGDARP